MFLFNKKISSGIQLFNSKSREKEIFKSIKDGEVKMYSCGPTVYDYVQIGNLRAYVFGDLLRRTFEYAGYNVRQVMNFTDFGHLVGDADDTEDKMVLALKREGKELTMENMSALASVYIDAFQHDREEMNILKPHIMPRASEHVQGQIAYVQTLFDKHFAYSTNDGVYFDTERFPNYGVLGGSASTEHQRIENNDQKKNPRDFALWKFNQNLGWDAPWGKGFPGWHIECTAMATRYLGKTFDVHIGGVDHIAVHHNNEIAQAEAANNKTFVNYWLHNEFVTIDSRRIGKSLGNAITLKQLTDKGIAPLAYRYWLLTGHYRQKMNFTWEAVQGAQTALQRALRVFVELKGNGKPDATYIKRFEDALYDDLNTPECIAVLWDLLKDDDVEGGVKKATVLQFDTVLGVGFNEPARHKEIVKVSVVSARDIPEEVQQLVKEREDARKEKSFERADEIRAQIEDMRYELEDTAEGVVVRKK